ncbi:lactonase family protein [Nocardiopsis composta]|uniref:6-phosphogluconolactonase (Cycloisomerase 2 family) n=1 Tax=Nocardiopsis composta TaxID=157465 RepID=A0A7W8QN32_9ACTN|nr:lactonase family protein [Nocardiopsis composta]MBB5432471.1 6-phosphogluconolactonase (cycloisomerase 2 family) [Nocardiopsis composta]
MSERPLWIGTYTPGSEPEGRGAGVHTARLDTRTGELTGGGPGIGAVGPSFLALHPDGNRLYAVAERADGGLACFAAGPGGPAGPLWQAGTGGGSPCHVLVHPAGRHVIAANYADGSVSVHAAGGDAPGETVARITHTGSGPVADRQAGPHAHSTALAPGGRHLLIADLGTDELRCHPFDPDRPDPVGPAAVAARLAPGAGPRHIAVHPSGHLYVAGELDARVHVLRWDPQTARALPVSSAEAGTAGSAYPGEIALSPVGDRLYVSLRGPDTVAVFAVQDGGATLRHLADVPTGGAWPRHFALVGGHLVAANQNSGTITALPLDPGTGVPGAPVSELAVPDPACVLPAAD